MKPIEPTAQLLAWAEFVDKRTILEICERIGYGRVMQIAAAAWAEKDPVGALTVGPCRVYALQEGR